MNLVAENWRSPVGSGNAEILRVNHAEVFSAIAEIDALGNRLFKRASDTKIEKVNHLVGLSLLRRILTIFVGVRHLFEASAIEASKLVIRSQFETLLAIRYLVHGGRRDITPLLPSSERAREVRARYYMTAASRTEIYRRQAVLDGRFRSKVAEPSDRLGLQDEIASEIKKLDKKFKAQNFRFGALACYPPKGKKPQYHDRKKWYSFGFRKKETNTVKQLATRFGWADMYSFTYDLFSSLSHPSGYGHDLEIEDGRVELYSPYMAEAFELLAFFSCGWQCNALILLAKAYNPSTVSDAQAVYVRVQQAINRLKVEIPPGYF